MRQSGEGKQGKDRGRRVGGEGGKEPLCGEKAQLHHKTIPKRRHNNCIVYICSRKIVTAVVTSN